MTYSKNIHRITKYFLFSVLFLFPLCVAQDEIVQLLGDDDGFIQKPDSRRPYNLNGTSAADYYPQSTGYKTNSQYYKTVFFVIFGLGLTIFVCLLFVCFKVATVYEGTNTSSVDGTTVHPPTAPANLQATFTNRSSIQLSYVNSAFTSGFQGSDRPPDYTTVANNDAINRNSAFPQVVTTHIETPPPKYGDAPEFR